MASLSKSEDYKKSDNSAVSSSSLAAINCDSDTGPSPSLSRQSSDSSSSSISTKIRGRRRGNTFSGLWRSRSSSADSERETRGKFIDESHELYLLSSAMKKGIQMSFEFGKQKYEEMSPQSECVFSKSDFEEKQWFDLTTNTALGGRRASQKSDGIVFKAYAPLVFHRIRQLFNISSGGEYQQDQLFNLTDQQSPWIDYLANSKSGEYFFFSGSSHFMVKTMSHSELKFATETFLPAYYTHVEQLPDTFLVKLCGLFRVETERSRVYFFVMKSVFDTSVAIHSRYDLKGSSLGRELDEESAEQGLDETLLVFKDNDFKGSSVDIIVGADRQDIASRLTRDVRFLQSINVMDYSLLLGIHDRRRYRTIHGNSSSNSDSTGDGDGKRRVHCKSSSEPISGLTPLSASRKGMSMISRQDPPNHSQLCAIHEQHADQKEEDGMLYLDELGSGMLGSSEGHRFIYWFGVIDVFQQYNAKKKLEYRVKGKLHDKRGISSIPAEKYAERFLESILPHIKSE